MEKDSNQSNKHSCIKNPDFFPTNDKKADLLLDDIKDNMDPASESSLPKAPPGEFKKIMDEMEKRNISPRIRWELRIREFFRFASRGMRRPVVVGALAVVLLFGTAAGVSAKKAYNYRVGEKRIGESGIVVNNDENNLSGIDRVEKAYQEIKNSLGIRPLKMMSRPFDMKFNELKMGNGNATMVFSYKKNLFYFIQINDQVTVSNGFFSDRLEYKEVYNEFLNKWVNIEQNKLDDGQIEYSCRIDTQGAVYYLSGIIEETEFIDIIKYLGY